MAKSFIAKNPSRFTADSSHPMLISPQMPCKSLYLLAKISLKQTAIKVNLRLLPSGNKSSYLRRGGRAVEGARLESGYTVRYREFESHPLRHYPFILSRTFCLQRGSDIPNRSTAMRNNYVLKSYAKSLLLIALLAVVVVTTRLVVEVFFVDVIHGNPHRSATDTRELILFMMPLISLTVFIGVFVVFAIPQILQGSLACLLEQVFGHKGSWGIFLALPVTACMTWYCYEYFTPTDMATKPR